MKNIYLILLALFVMTSCEDVIDVDIENRDPELVMDGRITNKLEKCKIKLSTISPFFEDDFGAPVDDATVTLSDDQGNSFDLIYSAAD